jgi:hypothetical protein
VEREGVPYGHRKAGRGVNNQRSRRHGNGSASGTKGRDRFDDVQRILLSRPAAGAWEP